MTGYFYNKANKQSYSIKLKIKYNICLNTFLWNTHNIFYLSVKLNNEIYAIQLFLNDFGVFLNSVTYDDCSGFRNVEFINFPLFCERVIFNVLLNFKSSVIQLCSGKFSHEIASSTGNSIYSKKSILLPQ